MKPKAATRTRPPILAYRAPAATAPIMRPAFQLWLAIGLLIAVPLIALASAVCPHDFTTWDDADQIVDNPTMNPVTEHSLVKWWTTPRMDLYAPVTYTIWGAIALVAREPGNAVKPAELDAAAFHSANFVAHVLCGLVVFALLRILVGASFTPSPGTPVVPARWTRGGDRLAFLPIWPALVGALLFELHPVQIEPVAWISGGNTVFSALFAFTAVWQYLLAVRRKSDGRDGWGWQYGEATVLYALAMLAKPAGVIAPLIALVLDCMLMGRSWKSALRWLWPWFVLAAVCAMETVLFQHETLTVRNVPVYQRPLVALDSIVFYLGKLFWPTRLTVDYGLRPDAMLHDRWLVGKCLLVAAIVLALWLLRRRAKPVVAGALIFLIPLLPVLGFLTFDFQWYSNVADHYLYMPMLGIALAVAWACQKWNRWPMYAGSAVALTLLAVVSHVQGSVWQNTQTLFDHNLAVNPTSSAAFDQFTRLALDQRDPTLALSYARQEIARHSDDVYAYRASGIALGQEGKSSDAIGAYRRALDISPDDTLTLEDMAGAMMETGEFVRAEQFARRAAAADLDSADAHFDLGFILNQEKKLTEAKEQFERAVALDPDTDRYHNLLAKVLEETGQRDLAIQQYRIALQLNPNSGPAKAGLRRLGPGN